MGTTVRLRLSDVDRERYQCKEWLDVDLDAIDNWEAALIQRGFTKDGIRVAFDSPGLWLRALPGEVVTDENNAPVMEPVNGPDGPTAVPRRRPDIGAELVLVWLALRHSGTDVPMDQVRYRINEVDWEIVGDDKPQDEPVPGEPEGKGDAASLSSSESTPISTP